MSNDYDRGWNDGFFSALGCALVAAALIVIIAILLSDIDRRSYRWEGKAVSHKTGIENPLWRPTTKPKYPRYVLESVPTPAPVLPLTLDGKPFIQHPVVHPPTLRGKWVFD